MQDYALVSKIVELQAINHRNQNIFILVLIAHHHYEGKDRKILILLFERMIARFIQINYTSHIESISVVARALLFVQTPLLVQSPFRREGGIYSLFVAISNSA